MRLIDADELKDTLLKHRYTTEHNQIFRYIDEQPIAYDIDKVVDELEKLADENYKAYCIAFNSDDRAEYDAYTNAIEIVKQGGVSDDVCEWKQTSTAKYKTECGYKLEEYFDTNACYCKQCGKKIEVVE